MFKLFYNQRIKTYPNGTQIITTFNRNVFNPYGFDREVDLSDRAPPDILPFGPDIRVRLDNLKRSREHVFDIALMNSFDYFVTLTIDPKKLDSSDYDFVNRKIKKWFNNLVTRNNVKYLCVPELHKSGKVHFHLLMSGELDFIDSGTVLIPQRKKPVKLSNAVKICPDLSKHKIVYNLSNWKYGHSTLIKFEKCDDGYNGTTAIAKYLVKYLTKDLTKIMRNYYYAGGHLQREVKTDYRNIPFESVFVPELDVPNSDLKVKYQTIGVI